jgi:hypothetical protein
MRSKSLRHFLSVWVWAVVALNGRADSPVGAWEISIGGDDRGLAYLTFYEDQTLDGYGISWNSFSVFTVEGTWQMTPNGEVLGSYTENLRGTLYTGNLVAKVKLGKSLKASASGTSGTFKLTGRPEAATPNLSGEWVGLLKQAGYRVVEYFEISPLSAPHLFLVEGHATGVSGPFEILGAVIVGGKGQVYAFAELDFCPFFGG